MTLGPADKLEAAHAKSNHAELGSQQLVVGVPHAGLFNIFKAYRPDRYSEADLEAFIAGGDVPDDKRLAAQLGEALRVYARDELFSKPDSLDQIRKYLKRSIDCLERASELTKGDTGAFSAWVKAHRAAGYTSKFWLSTVPGLEDVNGSAAADFSTAKAGFADAIRSYAQNATREINTELDLLLSKPESVSSLSNATKKFLSDSAGARWALRFLAFLLTLRGEARFGESPSDFAAAQAFLKAIPDYQTDSSIVRGIALLSSYVAGAPGANSTCATQHGEFAEERKAAAKEALNQALTAVESDHEEFFGMYTAAGSAWLLSHLEGGETYQQDLDSYIRAARVRSSNAISQAHATLLGLALLEAMEAQRLLNHDDVGADERQTLQDKRNEAVLGALAVLQQLEAAPLDIETQAIILRDPIWTALRNDPAFIHIRELLLPLFDRLRARVSTQDRKPGTDWKRVACQI